MVLAIFFLADQRIVRQFMVKSLKFNLELITIYSPEGYDINLAWQWYYWYAIT